MSKKRLILLGASGNIGEQTLSVLQTIKHYDLVAFSVGKQDDKIIPIIKEHPEVQAIYLSDVNKKKQLEKQYPHIHFYSGKNGIVNLINHTKADMVLNALVGFTGLAPTLAIIKNNMDLALANKESLVVGGELVNKALKDSKSKIYPVDSEHSAIYKCYQLVKNNDVENIILTASGGAFRHLSHDELKNVTSKEALKHPTWKMGPKVTIDSASMLNKGFEVIEAYYLFRVPLSKIQILMHDESYVHSLLKLKDGRYIAEVNPPSMKNPIAYALKEAKHPTHMKIVNSLNALKPFHFHPFNPKRYPMVNYAKLALKKGGIMPAVLNAVDEVAVASFLDNKISFLDIEKIIALSLKHFPLVRKIDLKTLIKYDNEARLWAKRIIKEHKF